jgi:predicted ArsR family transcriptional regulator
VKIAGSTQARGTELDGDPSGRSEVPAEGRTRDAVARSVLEHGPSTAALLAERLALSAAAIRRHLDALVTDGLLVEVEPRLPSSHRRGRGRPARAYALTDAGRASFGHAYDDLASTALRYLRQTGGDAAVRAFADHRASSLAEHISLRINTARPGGDAALPGTSHAGSAAGPKPGAAAEWAPGARVELIAQALTDEGYAANSEPAGQGMQICQHHCPVAHVAAEFPELCEAETRALSEVLGTYVQRLATIAHGDGVCTTHVPNAVPPKARQTDSRSMFDNADTQTTSPTGRLA